MATIVSLNKIEINAERPLDGVDLIPFLTGKDNGIPHDQLFWRKWEHSAMAIRKGNYKLVANRDKEKQLPELYHIGKDTSEGDILQNEEAIYDAMMTEWNQWNLQMKDRIFPTLQEKWWEK